MIGVEGTGLVKVAVVLRQIAEPVVAARKHVAAMNLMEVPRGSSQMRRSGSETAK